MMFTYLIASLAVFSTHTVVARPHGILSSFLHGGGFSPLSFLGHFSHPSPWAGSPQLVANPLRAYSSDQVYSQPSYSYPQQPYVQQTYAQPGYSQTYQQPAYVQTTTQAPKYVDPNPQPNETVKHQQVESLGVDTIEDFDNTADSTSDDETFEEETVKHSKVISPPFVQ